MENQIEVIRNEVEAEFANKASMSTLMAITFKGLTPQVAKTACLDACIRGFTIKDFRDKNVYAIPFKEGYSLVTSIDYARKIGMRSGVCGKSAPTYEMDGDKVLSCTVTVKRQVQNYVGDYSATVYMNEYTTGRNLWTTKPRTMLAKVAEMHALRMACPEELSQAYVEEEKESEIVHADVVVLTIEDYEKRLRSATTTEELRNAWALIPKEFHGDLREVANGLKKTLIENKTV